MPGPQALLQLGPQEQLQLSRFALCVAGQPSAAASHTHPQALASNTKPAAQVALCTHSQAQALVLQRSKPPQVALQSRAQAGVQVARSQRSVGERPPPQSAGHSQAHEVPQTQLVPAGLLASSQPSTGQVHWQVPGSQVKPGPGWAPLQSAGQTQAHAAVSHMRPLPQVPPQSSRHSGSQVAGLHVCPGPRLPPQSEGHTH